MVEEVSLVFFFTESGFLTVGFAFCEDLPWLCRKNSVEKPGKTRIFWFFGGFLGFFFGFSFRSRDVGRQARDERDIGATAPIFEE